MIFLKFWNDFLQHRSYSICDPLIQISNNIEGQEYEADSDSTRKKTLVSTDHSLMW